MKRIIKSAEISSIEMPKDPNYRVSDVSTTFSNKELRITYCAIFITLIAAVLLGTDVFGVLAERLYAGEAIPVIEQAVFTAIIYFLVYGNLVYQFSRLGYLKRSRVHRAETLTELDSLFDSELPSLTILVPSFKEEPRVVTQTLLSAALQGYGTRNVVLLIDDPANPSDVREQMALEEIRAIPDAIQSLCNLPATQARDALEGYLIRRGHGSINLHNEAQRLSTYFHQVADWFACQASEYKINDHTDRLFVDKVFSQPSELYRDYAKSFADCSEPGMQPIRIEVIHRSYKRLAALYDVELSSFQRKRYENLSHEPNKAMNLNSYIGLMGGRYREQIEGESLNLLKIRSAAENIDLEIQDSEYLITLDADSILSHDYALRLVSIMVKTGNERLAVAQTPYSTTPNAPGVLERIAGATTDIQYIIHQGFTQYESTFWVGANALLRKIALHDVATYGKERGFPIVRYIQDRTVIEDTESSVDMIARGWRLYNYPERLANSATPPDFGSLLIQRRRWANGGLIILPKLMNYLLRGKPSIKKLRQGFFQFHYLTSLAAVNLGVIALLIYPFNEAMLSWWLPLTAIPYFVLYGRDLMLNGYRYTDLFRVYALNLLLIPVNLGGVFKSIQQLITRRKQPFCRTPKVSGRTGAPAFYVLFLLGFTSYCLINAVVDFAMARWVHGTFALFNGCFLAYAIMNFIGLKEAIEDIAPQFRELQHSLSTNVSFVSDKPMIFPASVLPGFPRNANRSDAIQFKNKVTNIDRRIIKRPNPNLLIERRTKSGVIQASE